MPQKAEYTKIVNMLAKHFGVSPSDIKLEGFARRLLAALLATEEVCSRADRPPSLDSSPRVRQERAAGVEERSSTAAYLAVCVRQV